MNQPAGKNQGPQAGPKSSAVIDTVFAAYGAFPPVPKPAAMAVAVLSSVVRAGFPSPAEDYVESMLDLNEHLIHHPAATFIVRVAGDSMTGAGIFPDDLLVVDRSIPPANGRVVIAMIAGGLTVKRLEIKKGRWALLAANPDYPPIDISPAPDDGQANIDANIDECVIWGVVTATIRKY